MEDWRDRIKPLMGDFKERLEIAPSGKSLMVRVEESSPERWALEKGLGFRWNSKLQGCSAGPTALRKLERKFAPIEDAVVEELTEAAREFGIIVQRDPKDDRRRTVILSGEWVKNLEPDFVKYGLKVSKRGGNLIARGPQVPQLRDALNRVRGEKTVCFGGFPEELIPQKPKGWPYQGWWSG